MKRCYPIAAAFLVVALIGCTAEPSPTPSPGGSNPAPVQPAPLPQPKPAAKVKLLFFTQSGCAPCARMKAMLHDPALRDAIARFDLEEVQPPDPSFREYRVTGTPTLIALAEGGAKRFPGGTLGQLAAWLDEQAPKQAEKISEGGPTSPDGKVSVVCDLPASERKKNIASRGLGCCVFRSIEYAARWQQVPELYDLPEQMVKAGIAGGGYPEKVTTILKKFAPNVSYIQDTSGDPEILEAILASGRMPCVTYNGHDVHYRGGIAHMVCLPYFDRKTGWACVSDNNYTKDSEFVWMTCEEFLERWKGGGGSGWVVALLSAPPPPCPHSQHSNRRPSAAASFLAVSSEGSRSPFSKRPTQCRVSPALTARALTHKPADSRSERSRSAKSTSLFIAALLFGTRQDSLQVGQAVVVAGRPHGDADVLARVGRGMIRDADDQGPQAARQFVVAAAGLGSAGFRAIPAVFFGQGFDLFAGSLDPIVPLFNVAATLAQFVFVVGIEFHGAVFAQATGILSATLAGPLAGSNLALAAAFTKSLAAALLTQPDATLARSNSVPFAAAFAKIVAHRWFSERPRRVRARPLLAKDIVASWHHVVNCHQKDFSRIFGDRTCVQYHS